MLQSVSTQPEMAYYREQITINRDKAKKGYAPIIMTYYSKNGKHKMDLIALVCIYMYVLFPNGLRI